MAPVILVVDNHPEFRTFIERTLRLRGYEVTAVADGEAALAAAAVQFPNLVIAEVRLPGMTGLHVINTLRQQDPLLPAMALSTVPDVLEHAEEIPAGLELASLSFLVKPVTLPDFMNHVILLLRPRSS